MPNGTDDLFTVTESLPISADAIGVERNTVEGWRYTAHNGGKSGASRGGAFTVHRILASVADGRSGGRRSRPATKKGVGQVLGL